MMKIKFQTLDTSYPSSVSRQRRRAPQPEKTRENYGNYDTVMINGPRINQEEDNSFARMLARSAASQLSAGASPERVQELGRQVADGTYQPDAQKIAGRLLGLN